MSKVNPKKLAVMMMVFSTVINSTGGLLIRNIEAASDWQIVFWRGLALAGAIFCIMFFQSRGTVFSEFRCMGWLGVVGGIFYSGTIIGYVLALSHTTVANAVFTMSAIPFFTLLIAWLVLGERVNTRTLLAIVAAFVGITLMLGDGISAGSVFGNVMALFAAVCFACFVVILRKGRRLNMLPATAIGSLLATVLAIFVLNGNYHVTLQDLAICMIWGGVIASAGHFLVVSASRHLSGVELTLIILIEFILGPIWVWLFINEVPSVMTLIGGAVVLSAVGGHSLVSIKR